MFGEGIYNSSILHCGSCLRKAGGKTVTAGRVKLFSSRGISGLQANSFQKPPEEIGNPAFQLLPWCAPCRRSRLSVIPVELGREGSQELLSWGGVRGWQSLCGNFHIWHRGWELRASWSCGCPAPCRLFPGINGLCVFLCSH